MAPIAQAARPGRTLVALAGAFLFFYLVPFETAAVSGALLEAFAMLAEYARDHVLLCLVPAFFVAGAIMVFLNQQSVIRYLGPEANRGVAYGVAAISGTILAVCSCTVLPIFKGIYKKGAGIGPAVSFLYSGPAINILAIILTVKVLGLQLGVARAVGAILFAVAIGLLMQVIFRRTDAERVTNAAMFTSYEGDNRRSLGQTATFMASMIGILVFVNWAPASGASAAWEAVYRAKYAIATVFALVLVYAIVRWFSRSELRDWTRATRDFAIQIMPLLFAGVLVAGFLLGRPGHAGIVPERWVATLVGGNSLGANFAAALAGALMYFATLTEVPIMQGLIGAGMGNGPALSLLLAGPSLSLPSILVIHGELGFQKTAVYIALVVGLSTLAGVAYGTFAG